LKGLCQREKGQGQKEKREELYKMMPAMKTLAGLALPFHQSKLTRRVKGFQFDIPTARFEREFSNRGSAPKQIACFEKLDYMHRGWDASDKAAPSGG
jgi:hypothetical protein